MKIIRSLTLLFYSQKAGGNTVLKFHLLYLTVCQKLITDNTILNYETERY